MDKKFELRFKVFADDSMVNIDSKDNTFVYYNIKNMYNPLDGHGLLSEEKGDNSRLLKMCAKISNAIYKYLKAEARCQKKKDTLKKNV